MRKEEKLQRLISREYQGLLSVITAFREGTIGISEAMFCITETITNIVEKYGKNKN